MSNNYIRNTHPINYQKECLEQEFNLKIPNDLVSYLQELATLAEERGMELETICEDVRSEIEKKWLK